MTAAIPDLWLLSRLLDEAPALPAEQVDTWLAGLPAEQQRQLPLLCEMLAEHRRPDRPGFMSDGRRLDPRFGDDTDACAGDLVDGRLTRQAVLMLPRLAWGAGLAERMARDRDIGALLEHPNIARLYDAGVDDLGRPYLALEYIEGRALDAWCDAQALGLGRGLQLFLQVARAVAYAHGRLVVHRDLKPSNVLIGAGEVRVALAEADIHNTLFLSRQSTFDAARTIIQRDRAAVDARRPLVPDSIEAAIDFDLGTIYLVCGDLQRADSLIPSGAATLRPQAEAAFDHARIAFNRSMRGRFDAAEAVPASAPQFDAIKGADAAMVVAYRDVMPRALELAAAARAAPG